PAALCGRLDRLVESPPDDGLVRDYEDTTLVLGSAMSWRGRRRLLAHLTTEEPDQDEHGEDHEDCNAPPAPSYSGREDDRREVAHRPDHEAVGLGLAAERLLHVRS